MNKRTITLICGVALTTCLWAQKQVGIKVHRVNSSVYFVTPDTNKVSFEIAEKVALKFGMEKYHENNFSKSYKCKVGLGGVYSTAFVSQPMKPAIESYIKLYDGRLDLKVNEQVYLYGFTSALVEGKKLIEITVEC